LLGPLSNFWKGRSHEVRTEELPSLSSRLARLDSLGLERAFERSRGLVPAITERMQRRALTGELIPRAAEPLEGEARHSAVLALLYPWNGKPTLALTHRADHLGRHSGQVSLPGGRIDPSDESLWHTAVREMHEELGVLVDSTTPIAELERIYVPVSNFFVTAFVAWVQDRPDFVPNPDEVAALIEVSLEELFHEETFVVAEREYQGERVVEGFFNIKGPRIWGATALLLDQMRERLARGLERESGSISAVRHRHRS
jgi:8-oxo-dGTP pyrophosphatase MutT (NUDIX family)